MCARAAVEVCWAVANHIAVIEWRKNLAAAHVVDIQIIDLALNLHN